MQAKTDDVQRFITFYDAIRSNKTAAVSRRDLDMKFLAAQFENFFFLGWEADALSLYFAAPKLVGTYNLQRTSGPLSDILSPRGAANFLQLFEEMHQDPDRGILARFAKSENDLSEGHELVMLPVVAPGEVTAIGVITPFEDAEPGAQSTPPDRMPRKHMPLLQKSCFDIRVSLPPWSGGFLIQCITAMGKRLLGRKTA